MNILIIEDDIYLAERLKKVFEKKLISNRINILHDYESFVRELPVIDSYDLVLTDILLGELHDKTGIDVINTIRKKNIKVPVVVISSFWELEWLEKAFDSGASDYIIKPFRLKELELRVLKWFRIYFCSFRFGKNRQVNYHGLEYRLDENEFFYNGKQLVLTRKSKYLLSIFLSKPEKVFKESYLIEKIWGDILLIVNRNLRVSILRLKKDLDTYGLWNWIQNVRGEGYMLLSQDM